MGSKILAIVDQDYPAPNLQNVPAWFEEWEQILSRFRIDSELSRLNARAGLPLDVSSELWEVHKAALEAHLLTGGLVDPLILQDVLQAGYDRSFEQMSQSPLEDVRLPWMEPGTGVQLAAARPAPGSLMVDPERRRLRVPEGAGLDYGGIAKGWAANEAMRRLSAAGPALVSAGGDIAVSGPKSDGQPWAITVEDPFHFGGFVETLYVTAGGVATSGRDHRQWVRPGGPMHHVIDPRTGLPAQTDIVTATVVAGTAVQAEAFAKAVMILGSQT